MNMSGQAAALIHPSYPSVQCPRVRVIMGNSRRHGNRPGFRLVQFHITISISTQSSRMLGLLIRITITVQERALFADAPREFER